MLFSAIINILLVNMLLICLVTQNSLVIVRITSNIEQRELFAGTYCQQRELEAITEWADTDGGKEGVVTSTCLMAVWLVFVRFIYVAGILLLQDAVAILLHAISQACSRVERHSTKDGLLGKSFRQSTRSKVIASVTTQLPPCFKCSTCVKYSSPIMLRFVFHSPFIASLSPSFSKFYATTELCCVVRLGQILARKEH